MTLPPSSPAQCFGTNLVAMVTPMETDGSVSKPGVTGLVDHLVATGCDGIVVAGTAGEAPTLTDPELTELITLVRDRAADRARIVVGIGTNDTVTSIERAQRAEEAGADGLLLVCPYYSRPTQDGIIAHCSDVADATSLPVMLYDIPGRTGTPMEAATLVQLSQHPRIRAVKDAKGDLFEAMSVMAGTDLAYYCGIDELNLPYLASGATGLVSVVGNVTADRNADLIRAVAGGDLSTARAIHTALSPLTEAIMQTSQGAIMAKAALHELRVIRHPTVRRPLVPGPEADREKVAAALVQAGVTRPVASATESNPRRAASPAAADSPGPLAVAAGM
ncbi:4-hydroxy-tetrahydrodipicolinate synthase [Brevibacterium jeotgali]|uniref:4-hydroxy-tetrahydrodipicolinate synthase n=1 Tax=Brevibacterium jeotgali TaxID=1262550 RepID=A0A2H1L3X2_9MICO|nr:4-hydroxy-tetrahydrodipicolinate synthase [Brevibacterium jeotgali]TWC03080.1 4-hydroxy-tetrahydrodipicolinate synthase [Brevibacterium jeotgali]SMY11103.1 4-hydroxy-tetrahydrodipicolinate synthase [Brevibacterium jeotgali]